MRSLFSNDQGQVQSIAPAVLALTFAAIVLIFGIIMSQGLTDTRIGTVSETVANESIFSGNFSTTHNYTLRLAGLGGYPDGSTSIVSITNYSGTVLQSTNYTLYPDGNIILLANGYTTNFTQANLSYTASYGGVAYDAGNSTVFGLGTFADFWEIIVLAIIITVVIGLLLVVFGGRKQR